MARHQELRELLHDLRNVLGIVHVCAVNLREAHDAGEELGPRIRDLESLAALAAEVLRGLGAGGRAARPFDLRAAVFCARTTTPQLALGELLIPLTIDAPAGGLIDLVAALAHAFGPGAERIDVSQDRDGTLLFTLAAASRDDLARAHAAIAERAGAVSLSITIAPAGLALRPR